MYKRTAMQALDQRRDIERFSKRYGAYIGESRSYRERRVVPMMIDDFRDAHRYDVNRSTYDVPYVEIHMPEAAFEQFMRIEEANAYDSQQVNHAMSVLRQHREDERVRDRNPAVQKAWMKYITLLELTRT